MIHHQEQTCCSLLVWLDTILNMYRYNFYFLLESKIVFSFGSVRFLQATDQVFDILKLKYQLHSVLPRAHVYGMIPSVVVE